MTQELVYNRVKSESSRVPGRSVNQVRSHYFIVDDPSIGDSMTPADHFVSGIAACASNHMELKAHREEMGLQRIEVEIEARRDKADTSVFLGIDILATFEGVSRETAAELIESYKSHCPLYKCVALATDVKIDFKVVE